jgi:signal peptidase I
MQEGAHHEPPDGRPLPPEEPPSTSGAIREVVVTVTAAVVLAFLIQAFLVKPYRIPSGSMENTLRCGDRVLVDRVSYRFSDPERGDVIVFNPPAYVDLESGVADRNDYYAPRSQRALEAGDLPFSEQEPARVNFIKRIVGMPGDTVEMRDGRTWVNDEPLDEPYLHGNLDSDPQGPWQVPDGTYFMMGDNRTNSADSRVWGPLRDDFVIGKGFMIYWPIGNFGGIPAEDPGGTTDGRPDPACLGRDVDLIGSGWSLR